MVLLKNNRVVYSDMGERGQILVALAVGLLVILSLAGLIMWGIDAVAAMSDPYGIAQASAAPQDVALLAKQTAQPAKPTRQAEPTRTPQPTATPVPTIDLVMQAKVAAVVTESAATAQAICATQTQETIDGNNRANSTAAAGTATAQAVGTQGAFNVSANRTAVAEQVVRIARLNTATAQAIDTAAKLDRTKADIIATGLTVLFAIVGIGAAGLFIVLCGYFGAKTADINRVNKMTLPDFTGNVPPTLTPSRGIVGLDHRDADGFGFVDLEATPPGDAAAFTQLCDMVYSGEKTLAINEWEGAEVIYTRATYAPVYRWLAEKKFITVENSRKVFNKNGLKYADNWLQIHADLLPAASSVSRKA